jgi:hypothetical protein
MKVLPSSGKLLRRLQIKINMDYKEREVNIKTYNEDMSEKEEP